MVPGKGLVFSLILENDYPINNAGLIALATSLAAVESLDKRGLKAKLKWPNDIFVSGKKIGGILCETKIIKKEIKNMVIGVGLNVNETISEHPEIIRKVLTTMFEVSNHPHQRELIVAEYINSIERLLNTLTIEPKQIIDKWLKKNKNNYETIKYRQWYEPYVINNQWVCRVEYDETIGGLTITSDMMFFIEDNEVVSFSEK